MDKLFSFLSFLTECCWTDSCWHCWSQFGLEKLYLAFVLVPEFIWGQLYVVTPFFLFREIMFSRDNPLLLADNWWGILLSNKGHRPDKIFLVWNWRLGGVGIWGSWLLVYAEEFNCTSRVRVGISVKVEDFNCKSQSIFDDTSGFY